MDVAGIDECACCGPDAPRGHDDSGACVSDDKRVLLEAKAAADTSTCGSIGSYSGSYGRSGTCPLDSWTADTEPCGDGYDDKDSGWVGVKCDARGGRVVVVSLAGTGVGGELLPFFGRLGALLVLLKLSFNPALRGDVADLAGATELRELWLLGCPLVVGEAAALAALVHLGEDCSVCNGGVLYLAGSGVHGPVAALRALPGLGADWGPVLDGPEDGGWWERGHDFSPCSAFGGQQASNGNDYTWGTGSPGCDAAGLAPVAVSPHKCRSFACARN